MTTLDLLPSALSLTDCVHIDLCVCIVRVKIMSFTLKTRDCVLFRRVAGASTIQQCNGVTATKQYCPKGTFAEGSLEAWRTGPSASIFECIKTRPGTYVQYQGMGGGIPWETDGAVKSCGSNFYRS